MGGSAHFNAKSKRWFISVYWQKRQYTIWRYNGEPIWHEKTATKLLGKIRGEVDDGTFNPKAYLPDSPLSLKKYSEEWLAASQACTNTKRVYRSSIKSAISFLGAECDIRHITHSRLLQLYNNLPHSEKGRYNVLTALKTMLRAAYKDELLKKVPPFPRLSMGLKTDPDYLELSLQYEIIEQIPERDRPIFLFMSEWGTRPQEARALKKDCLLPDKILIRRAMSDNRLVETTKEKRIRKLGYTTRTKLALDMAQKFTPFSQFVFAKNQRGTPYRGEDLNRIWREACGKVGIYLKLYNSMRHTRVGTLLDAGHSYEEAADIVGHSSIKMTRDTYGNRSVVTKTAILEGMGNVVPFERKEEGNAVRLPEVEGMGNDKQ